MLRLFEVFFFSLRLLHWIKAYLNKLKYTTVVKLAYTLDSKSSGAIHKGSIPFSRTNKTCECRIKAVRQSSKLRVTVRFRSFALKNLIKTLIIDMIVCGARSHGVKHSKAPFSP